MPTYILPEYSILDRLKMNPELHLQDGEYERFRCMQSSIFTPQSSTSQLPAIMQRHVSLQNQLPEYSILDRLKLNPELHLLDSEPESFRLKEPSIFIPANQLSASMQGHVSLPNQSRGSMYDALRTPHLWTDRTPYQAKGFKSTESVVDTIPSYAHDLYQQCIQQQSGHLQLQHHMTPLSFPSPLPYLSTSMHAPLPLMSPAQKSSLCQMTPGDNQLSQPNSEEIKNIEDMQQSVETFKKLETELDSGMGCHLPKARPNGNSGEESDNKMSDGDSSDSDEEINVVDMDNDDDKDEDPSQPPISNPSGKCKVTTNEQAVHMSKQDPNHNASFSKMTGVMGLKLPNQDGNLYAVHQQKPQLQTDQVTFNVRKDMMASNPVVDTIPAYPHQLYPQCIQQLPLPPYVTPLSIPHPLPDYSMSMQAPLPHFLTFTPAPLPLMTAPSSSQMSRVCQHNEPSPEQLEEEMHDLAKRFKIRREVLGYTPKKASDELNNLTREYSMYGEFTKWSILNLENQKITPKGMLKRKPVLELWLDLTRKRTPLRSVSATSIE